MKDGDKRLVRLYALQNAVFYKGKASPEVVLGKVLAEVPELRKGVGEVRKLAEQVVKEVNSIPLSEQEKELGKASPRMLRRKRKEDGMPGLKGAVMGKVVTRFAPAPTGPLTIFHLTRAAFLSYYYARRYKGIFVVRMEDSDPAKVKAEFYDYILEDLKSVGIKYDRLVLESGHMEAYYKHAEKMIKSGKAYVCLCPAEAFRELKKEKKNCPCRAKKPDQNMKDWKGMLDGRYKQGEAVLRLATGMSEPNPVMRDPPMFRISDIPHPRAGRKYRVWPLYNFACAVEDHLSGVTHVFRAKEHEHNTAVQRLVYDFFGWKQPVFINFGLVYFPGAKLHKRDIKASMDRGVYTGWDDPRLPTVKAFLRRGFLPETFEALSKSCGLSKNDIRIGWENLEGINRKFLDPKANRYMAVINPVRISVEGNVPKSIKIERHPDFPERGGKTVPVKADEVYVSVEDFEKLKGKKIRLIGLGNIKLSKKSEYSGNEISHEMQKIQFVSSPHVKVEILMPDSKTLKGLGEPEMKKLKVGDVIQMNRVGFARVDKAGKGKVRLVFAHK